MEDMEGLTKEKTGPDFYKGKKVLITGHTGFKGTWLTAVLLERGAEIYGFSSDERPIFSMTGFEKEIRCAAGDIRDTEAVLRAVREAQPDIIFHLAAQPVVRKGYADPVGTYGTNVMGTVNLLDAVRRTDCVRSVLNVTTDKVYENTEKEEGYRETDRLDGNDPYSNSKSCSELVTDCYRKSFLRENGTAVSTARAGNVIGGGDFAEDRIIPDCVRSVIRGIPVPVRNPRSVRPYQHVLDPVEAYLLIAQKQYDDPSVMSSYNIGPGETGCISTGQLVSLFTKEWGSEAFWKHTGQHGGPAEAGLLKLDCTRIRQVFGWEPVWDIGHAVKKTVEWYKEWDSGNDIRQCMERQIGEFYGER